MKHKRVIRKFGRNKSQRKALTKNLAVSFFESGHVTTTEAKARQLKRVAEKLITLARRGDVAGDRRINAMLNHPASVRKAREIADKCGERRGGYLQIVKMMPRRGDSARMAMVRVVPPAAAAEAPRKNA